MTDFEAQLSARECRDGERKAEWQLSGRRVALADIAGLSLSRKGSSFGIASMAEPNGGLRDRRESAVDVKVDPGDVAREWARQEGHRIGEFSQFSDPAYWDVGEQRQDATLDVLPGRIL
jgi:hypothetical protein